MEKSSNEGHLTAGEIELVATSPEFNHFLACTACADRVIRYQNTIKTTPLEDFPVEE